MKVAVLGAGFTGLTAALRLLQKGFEVTLIEKEPEVGGLAGGFKRPGWDWTLEKAYHHWFTSDKTVLNLAKELNFKVNVVRPQTNIYIKGQILPIDSPSALMTFPYLPLLDKTRAALTLAYLKLLNNHQSLEGKKALPWIKRYMGQKVMDIIWDPLFSGKFGEYKEEIALTWFWGRIKKRSPSLVYPEGGFQAFADKIAGKIKNLGGQILLNTEVKSIRQTAKGPSGLSLRVEDLLLTASGSQQSAVSSQQFDIVLSTLPTPLFIKVTPTLPKPYVKKISQVPHLSAQNLILILKKPFLKDTYWLNVNDPGFPFLLLAEQTNFMNPKHYGGEHILYIGNYLPNNHPYLKMSASQLFKTFKPFLHKINPNYDLKPITYNLFSSPFAQPVVDVNYLQKISGFETPLKRVFLANMDMVYPWDRETNYAAEMGEKVADVVDSM